MEVKGVTTAVKGSIPIKQGHGKDDIKMGYTKDSTYNGKETVEQVIESVKTTFNNDLSTFKSEHDKTIAQLENELKTLKQAFEETLKGLMTR